MRKDEVAESKKELPSTSAFVGASRRKPRGRPGFLARIFGETSDTVAPNIAAMTILILVVGGVAIALFPGPAGMSATDYWERAGHILGIALGFLFGRVGK